MLKFEGIEIVVACAAAHQLAIQAGLAIALKNHQAFMLLIYMLIPLQLACNSSSRMAGVLFLSL